MTPAESETVRRELAALTLRAEAAERRALRAEHQRDHLRALLIRTRTSLAEISDEALPLATAA